jgi:tetratricopeptide (TPR) repeat protein
MKRSVISLAALLAFALTLVAQRTATPEAQLGAIINQAEGEGNYEAAIPLFKKFLSENGKNKALAARAQYHLAVAYEKLGNPEARKSVRAGRARLRERTRGG